MNDDELNELLNSKNPMDLRQCRGLSSKVALFNKKADEHQEKQKVNPFSGSWEGAKGHHQISKDDARYGRPEEGSKTATRGKKALTLISKEILQLCDMINEYGEQYEDGTAAISFGELFQIYTCISSKVVGLLIRARKHGFVQFEGETLFQRRDDNVPIYLLKPFSEIRAEFKSQNKEDDEPEVDHTHATTDEPYSFDAGAGASSSF